MSALAYLLVGLDAGLERKVILLARRTGAVTTGGIFCIGLLLHATGVVGAAVGSQPAPLPKPRINLPTAISVYKTTVRRIGFVVPPDGSYISSAVYGPWSVVGRTAPTCRCAKHTPTWVITVSNPKPTPPPPPPAGSVGNKAPACVIGAMAINARTGRVLTTWCISRLKYGHEERGVQP